MRDTLLVLLILLGISRSSLGGPDKSTVTSYCADFYRGLKSERHSRAVRDAVQALQAIDSQFGQLKLGQPLPQPSPNDSRPDGATLSGWKQGNSTRLARLLEGTTVAASLGGSAAAAAAARTCMSNRLSPRSYPARPVVSVLLEYFKRPSVVNRIASMLRRNCAEVGVACELVVNVDNPHEAGAWAPEVLSNETSAATGFAGPAGGDGFVVPVFSSNVHESRGYNRAAKLARGRYLVIWQDDQIPPNSGRWIMDMVKVFDAHPHLGILGMNTYRLCKHTEPTNRFHYTAWLPDPKTGVKWTYSQTVDFAPLAIRASIFESIGGLDEGASLKGECGIWGDWELCARTWMAGWTVGYMYLDGRGGDGQPGGTHVGASGERCWGRQQFVASQLYQKRYGPDVLNDQWCNRVWLMNMVSFQLDNPAMCPYGSHETRFGNCSALTTEQAAEAEATLAALLAAERRIGGGGGGRGGGGGGGGGGLAAATGGGAGGHAAGSDAAAAGGGSSGGPGDAGEFTVIEVLPHIVRAAGPGR